MDADALNNDLDLINLDILALLARGKALLDDALPAFTEENRAAGAITYMQTSQPTQINEATGLPIPNPFPVTTRVPISVEQFAALTQRLTLLGQLTKMLDAVPSGGSKSYADKLRASGRRWRAIT